MASETEAVSEVLPMACSEAPAQGVDVDELSDQPVYAAALTSGAQSVDRPGARPWYRPRWKPLFLRLHRWGSLTSLVFVVLFFVSGVFMMYSSDLVRWTHSSWYHSTASAQRITPGDAVAAVRARDPQQLVFDAWVDGGVFRVSEINADGSAVTEVFVDPGTGQVNAAVLQEKTKTPFGSVGGFITNLHNCALSCKDMPGYIPFMAGQVPVLGWLWKSLVMMVASLAVILLAVTGVMMWWPGFRRWRRGFRLRRKNFHVFNVDLHRVLGVVAIPLLVMWGLTAITLVLPTATTELWHSVTGSADVNTQTQTAAAAAFAEPSSQPELTLEQATQRALAAAPGTSFVGVTLPDATGTVWGQPAYYYWFNLVEDHLDPARYSGTGSEFVAVGLYDGRTFGPSHGAAGRVWDNYRLGLHFGSIAGPWARLIFVFFGLAPVILSFTGVVMWWRRRKNRRLRKDQTVRALAGHSEVSEPDAPLPSATDVLGE